MRVEYAHIDTVETLTSTKLGVVSARTCEMVVGFSIAALALVASQRGTRLLAHLADNRTRPSQRRVHIDESAGLGLVCFRRPQSAIDMYPLIGVQIEQSSTQSLFTVTNLAAEAANTSVGVTKSSIALVTLRLQCGALLKTASYSLEVYC